MKDEVNRRDFFRISGFGAAMLALAACNPLGENQPLAPLMEAADDFLPLDPLRDAAGGLLPLAKQLEGEELIVHTLRRTTFGPTASEIAEARASGLEAWLETQLSPDLSNVPRVDQQLAELETHEMHPGELADLEQVGLVVRDLVAATLIHQIYSPWQLHEQMVDFWTNHFNIRGVGPPEAFLKGKDDREVIRPHALGNFPDLLKASAHSPAMLVYLDNARSQHPSPNENYARELLELHALGVDGGYTYNDIADTARAFTGWTVVPMRSSRGPNPGDFIYQDRMHDPDPKLVLGEELPGGKSDGDRVLEILAEHPSTAHTIAVKLVQRFVSDLPPTGLVEAVAKRYLETGGDIPSMLRTIFYSDAFAASAGLKLKRPLDYVISALRVTGAQSERPLGRNGGLERVLRHFLAVLGQVPHAWPAPDGYPDQIAAWTNTNQSLYRWNLGLVLASGLLPGVTTEVSQWADENAIEEEMVDALAVHILGSALPEDARNILIQFAVNLQSPELPERKDRSSLIAGMVLASPHFQIR